MATKIAGYLFDGWNNARYAVREWVRSLDRLAEDMVDDALDVWGEDND